ncbi:helix-turn-helix domain-containing protein [Nocardia sp. NPDC049220]|uniref:PucR family transcriptional regulator n=1 Tax=Nocardia sp. NPDC049220 TaxID=3155273 RepID=UPI0033FDBA0C
MTTFRRDGGVDVSGCVSKIAARMNERVTDISTCICRGLEEEIPELRADVHTIELLGASVKGNIDTMLHALQHDIPAERIHPPAAAIEYTRRLAQHEVPVTSLARAYHVGQWRMTEMVFAELRAADIGPMERITVAEAITTKLFEYLDRVIPHVIAVYEHEHEQWLDDSNSVRAVRVREVLDGTRTVDVDEATASIRYPLQWHHLALIVWYPDTRAVGDELTRLQRFVRESAEAADTAMNPLFVADDRMSAWAWLPFRSAHPDAIDRVRSFATGHPDAPRLAIGSLASGVPGFRRSHRLAQSARTVALARRDGELPIIAADDPGVSVAALLGGEITEVRQWVGEILGDLASDNDNDARLRETLQVFLRTGGSYKAAAAELDLHSNSVKYRVGRAVSRRGSPIAEDRLDIELALLVCYWYGSTVLRPDTP